MFSVGNGKCIVGIYVMRSNISSNESNRPTNKNLAVATRCHLLMQKCTKFDQTSLGELTALPIRNPVTKRNEENRRKEKRKRKRGKEKGKETRGGDEVCSRLWSSPMTRNLS